MKSAVIVTTYNRPQCLARSLPQIIAAAKEVRAQVLVVDDGSQSPEYGPSLKEICIKTQCSEAGRYVPEGDEYSSGIHLLEMPSNRGLAGALNIGLSYWLADPSIEAIHYFQDDVEVDPLAIAACSVLLNATKGACVVTGHDAREHRERKDLPCHPDNCFGIYMRGRDSCRATHMAATRESWLRVLPIPSRGLGLPSKTIRDKAHPERRGTGSGVDWWVVRDSPNKLPVLCVPGLVRTFAWKREDSCWDNEQIAGEDAPLSRAAIQEWVNARQVR